MDKKQHFGKNPDHPRIAGELSAQAARNQIHDSLVPLQRLADKNGFRKISILLEEAIRQSSRK